MQRARRRKKQYQDDKPDRWLISYADFITLLFAFFVVMYSISSVNEGKYRVLSDSITSAFKPSTKGLSIGPDKLINTPINGKIQVPIINTPAVTQNSVIKKKSLQAEISNEDRNLRLILKNLEHSFSRQINKKSIDINKNGQKIEIEIQANILFKTGSVQLAAGSRKLIDKIASNLKKHNYSIDVAGFTDNVPVRSANIPSNWELSASRAATIVRYLAVHGVKPERLSSTGYGEYRPIASNDTDAGRRKNRRMVIIISPDFYNRISGQYDGLNQSSIAQKIEPPTNIIAPFRQD